MINIIPKPLSIRETEGRFPFGADSTFSGEFEEVYGVIKHFLPAGRGAGGRVCFCSNEALGSEEYKIAVTDNGITVYAADCKGAFYAGMTLVGLSGGSGEVKGVEISDKPRYAHRGFMLDCARHFWTVEKIKQLLDFLALIKMNVFHWHLADDQGWRIEIEKYPLLTSVGAVRTVTNNNKNCSGHYAPDTVGQKYGEGLFYTKQQAREIVEYAAERFITVIPEIDLPGHLSAAIACYQELSCSGEKIEVPDEWGVLKNIGCPAKEPLYTFAENVIDELSEIFPSEYFHVGGDEVLTDEWEKCDDCRRLMKEEGLESPRDIQGYFNGKIADYLSRKGKLMVGWNEILNSKFADTDKMVGQWWIDSESDVERNWISNGGKMIMSFIDYVYMDHPYTVRPLEKTYSFEPEKLSVPDCAEILGIEVPQWTEHIRTEEKLDIYTNARLLAAAEIAWTEKEQKDYTDFEARVEGNRDFLGLFGIRLASHKFYSGRAYKENTGSDLREYWDLWHNDPDFEFRML